NGLSVIQQMLSHSQMLWNGISKETREDRDRSRLDSMVLLIMKLDQLDQDIENALSTASSPSSTPTNLRRRIPVSPLLPALS
ncbi:hypothetical protein STEG23_029780, partial [Scotinomys teguina]